MSINCQPMMVSTKKGKLAFKGGHEAHMWFDVAPRVSIPTHFTTLFFQSRFSLSATLVKPIPFFEHRKPFSSPLSCPSRDSSRMLTL